LKLQNCIGIISKFKLYIQVKRPAFLKLKDVKTVEKKIIKDDFTCDFRFDIESGNIFLKFNYPFTLMNGRLLAGTDDTSSISEAFELYI
jgi:hypothetical protein